MIYDEIDYLINLDINGRNNRLLYERARKEMPLCYEAAKFILNEVKNDDNVIITTGFPVLERIPESDGIVGSIFMAKFLKKLDANIIFLAEKETIEILKKMGIKAEYIQIQKENIERLMEEKPKMAISIEKPGMARDGKYYNMKGEDISRYAGKIDFLFEKIKSIGIGDGGNEIGMGGIAEGKIASITKTTKIVVSNVSNWGAYGIIAAASIILNENFVHDGKEEEKYIKKCIDAGAIDGITKKKDYSVDSIPARIHRSIVDMLHDMVDYVI